MSKAIYAFSGDPITLGHLDIIERAAKVFDELTVAIGVNPGKKYLFSLEERALLAKTATSHIPNVKVVYFHGLLVDYAYENNIPTVIRGLRNSEDFNFELMLHQIGESQKMDIDTFFIPSRQEFSHISSSAAKAIQLEQGLIHEYVPLNVKQKLEERLSGQFLIGVTGEIGAGKSYLCEKLKEMGKIEGVEVHKIDVDIIGHEILEVLMEPLFVKLRKQIAGQFGNHLLKSNGFVDVKELGKIIFSDIHKLTEFNELMYQPMLLRLRRALYGKRGIILLDSALIAESRMTHLCNNNVILVQTSEKEQLARLKDRNYSPEQIAGRLASQYKYDVKLKCIEEEIKIRSHGKIYHINNSSSLKMEDLKQVIIDVGSKLILKEKI